jgi:hypothetical protein
MQNQQYSAITQMLKKDNKLYLQLHHYNMSGGLKNARYVAIFEPNPNQWNVIDEGSDQAHYEGPIREKHGFEFAAKDSLEGLTLLERACAGERGVKSSVLQELSYSNQTRVPGHSQGQDNFDVWIFEGYKFHVQNTPLGLIASMRCYFFETNNVVISLNEVNNIDEGIEFYKNNPVSAETLHNLRRGIILDQKLSKEFDFKKHKTDIFVEQGNQTISPEFDNKYYKALNELTPFDLNNRLKDSLFISMLLSNFYTTDKIKIID